MNCLDQVLKNEVVRLQSEVQDFLEEADEGPDIKRVEMLCVEHVVHDLVPVVLQVKSNISQPHVVPLV